MFTKMHNVMLFDIIRWKGVDYVVNEIVTPRDGVGLGVHSVKGRKPNVIVGHRSHDIEIIRRNNDGNKNESL